MANPASIPGITEGSLGPLQGTAFSGNTFKRADTSFTFKPRRRPRRRFWVPLDFVDAAGATIIVWDELVWNGQPAAGANPFAPIGTPQAFIDRAMLWFEDENGPGPLQHGDVLVGKDSNGDPVEIEIVEDFQNPGNFQQAPP